MAKARKILEVPLSDIIVKDRLRKDLGDLTEMKESILEKGLIQPITINKNYELVAGGRRYTSHVELELPTIDCIVRETIDELDEREVELFENIHRKDMTWQEKIRGTSEIHKLMEQKHGHKWNETRTAKLLGKSQSAVNDALHLGDAMDVLPDLANMPTADAARKKLNRVYKDIKIKNALDKSPPGSGAKWAADHYHVGNAIDGLSQVNNNVATFAEVDPPYAIDLRAKRAGRNDGSDTSTGIDTYNEIPADAYEAFIRSTALQVYRVLTDNAFCIWWHGSTWCHEVITILREVGFHVDDIPGIWSKATGTTNNPNVYLSRSYEPFFICRKGNPAIRQPGRLNVFSFAGVPDSQRIHTTERPLELIRELLRTFAYPSARIVVPFLGSGNTLLAAYHEGMLGWGYDLSEKHKLRFLARVQEQFPEGVNE